MTDNTPHALIDLILCAKTGNPSALEKLLDQYKNMVKKTARTFFIMGADFEDIVQEGMIGLFGAIQSYDPDKGAGFETYASLCISRQILNALKSASRKKHAPLNFYTSLDFDGNEPYPPPTERSPEDLFILKEDVQIIITAVHSGLSTFESAVLTCFLEGMSHAEIAGTLEKNEKSIDNAIQRIRNKVRKLLTERSL